MATLYLDFSGNSVRVLITEGYRLVDVRTLGVQPEGAAGIKGLLAQIFAATGQKIDQAHLILPDSDVTTEVCKLQKMPLADAEKVLLRQGSAERALRLTEFAGQDHQLHCLAESVNQTVVARYLKSFADAGIVLATMVSPLQAVLAAFAPAQREMKHVEVVFSISSESVLALFLSCDEILHHEQVILPAVEEDAENTADSLRTQKRRQFAVLTPLHSIYSHFMLENPELIVDKIWLCGPYPGIEGVAESLVEATELDVVLADQIADFDEGSCVFTALAGVLRVAADPARFNFVSAEALTPAKVRPQVLLAAAAGAFCLLLAVLLFVTEKRVVSLKKALGKAQQELTLFETASSETKLLASSLDFLDGLDKNAPPFYEIFRELAETLPAQLDLQSLRYQKDAENSTFELIAVAEYGKQDGSDVFTALAGVLDRSAYLSDYTDPVIEVLSEGKAKLIRISVTCKLATAGGHDR